MQPFDINVGKKYAQHPSDSDRDIKGIDGPAPIGPDGIRDAFSRDRERITFTRAFRRLEHKAQVYSPEKGDHFRMRLTHTLEVAQIGRGIARNLGLNEDLVEAIALGHDIGHSPFGHQGERVLDEIMRGDTSLGDKIRHPMDFGGYRHSFQSVRILDKNEKKYEDLDGLNLTWQLKEGIMKHTKFKRHKDKECDRRHNTGECDRDKNNCYDLNRCLNQPDIYNDFFRYPFSCTLEGQIVEMADEIAQREHDLDDGLRDVNIGLKYDDVAKQLLGYISEISKNINSDMECAKLLLDLKEAIEKKQMSKDRLYKSNALVRDVIHYFIQDMTCASKKNIEKIDGDYYSKKGENCVFVKRVINFSDMGKAFNDRIEGYINNRIVNSEGVNKFDAKAIYIIKRIFKAYYENPRQMPGYVLERLTRALEGNSKNIYELKFKDGRRHAGHREFDGEGSVEKISFAAGRRDEIDMLISLLKLDMDVNELELPPGVDTLELDDEELKSVNKLRLGDIKDIKDNGARSRKLLLKCLLEDHYAYVSTICDYVSGMTDNYAKRQYEQLYLV